MAHMSKKKEVWDRIASHFESVLGKKDIQTWFAPATLKSMDPDLAVIEVPNKFFADWFRERYLPDLQTAFQRIAHMSPEIRFSLRPGTALPNNGSFTLETAAPPFHHLDPHMTFETFVRAQSNSFACVSCLEIADRKPRHYNPLFLFSDKSTGKTHLLHAVGNRLLTDKPPQRVRYVHADQFTSLFSRALKDHQIHAFRNGYTDLDVLLFDDVDRLGGRVKTQEECTFLFDTLLRDGKTLLVASRLPPFRLTDVAPRLTSILTWGLLAEIHAPDTETRIRVVREHARREDCPLPDDIIFFLAKSNDDMKYLFGQIARLQTYASLSGARLDLSTVRTLIRDQTRQELEPEDIKAITAGYFKLSISDLSSDRRPRSISYPRHMAMYLCRKYTSHSLKKIGLSFSKKDHSTVVYALRRIEEELNSNPDVRQDLVNLEHFLR